MHGRKLFALTLAAFALLSCSRSQIMSPDCHSCTAHDQEWDAFAWSALPGQWKGTVEIWRNEKAQAKKSKLDKGVELRILTADAFLKAQGAASCSSLPANALVVNGLLWQGASPGQTEFEAFVPVEDEKVAYGRLRFEKVNGAQVCNFRRIGPVMGTNRLALPIVNFSENGRISARGLASVVGDTEVSLEFLRFAPAAVKPVAFKAGGRKPASVQEEERPPLMIRVTRTSTRNVGERGQWASSEEMIYRFWKAN
jgi:hypothetical protein